MNDKLISQNDLKDLAQVMNIKHAQNLDGRSFDLAAWTEKDGIYVKVELRNDTRSFVYPVYGRLHVSQEGVTSKEGALLMMDYIDLYFEEYLKSGSVFLSLDFQNHEFEGLEFQLRGQIINEYLEEMAGSFLTTNHQAIN